MVTASPIVLTLKGLADGSGIPGQISPGTYSIAAVAAPIPEPETYAMMLAGLGAIGFMAARRRRRGRAFHIPPQEESPMNDLPEDVYDALKRAQETEESPVGVEVLGQLVENFLLVTRIDGGVEEENWKKGAGPVPIADIVEESWAGERLTPPSLVRGKIATQGKNSLQFVRRPERERHKITLHTGVMVRGV